MRGDEGSGWRVQWRERGVLGRVVVQVIVVLPF